MKGKRLYKIGRTCLSQGNIVSTRMISRPDFEKASCSHLARKYIKKTTFRDYQPLLVGLCPLRDEGRKLKGEGGETDTWSVIPVSNFDPQLSGNLLRPFV